MKAEEILEKILSHLSPDIKNEKSLTELASIFKNILREKRRRYQIQIREDIYEKIPEFKSEPSITVAAESGEIIFEFTHYDDDDICFSLAKDTHYSILLSVVKDAPDDLYDNTVIEAVLGDSTTTWKVSKYLTDESYYYYSYSFDLYSFNKNLEPLKIEGIEEEKDKDFSSFFNISINEARKCRLNFDSHREYLNKSKIRGQMERLDKIYCGDEKYFTTPFEMGSLEGMLLAFNSDESDYLNILDGEDEIDSETDEEIDEPEDEKTLERTGDICSLLTHDIGEEGEFVMTFNLLYNINTYIRGTSDALKTTGLFIKKLDGEYTLYWVYLNSTGSLIFPKICSKKEVQRFYESFDGNKCMEGLDEFFGYNKSYRLDFE